MMDRMTGQELSTLVTPSKSINPHQRWPITPSTPSTLVTSPIGELTPPATPKDSRQTTPIRRPLSFEDMASQSSEIKIYDSTFAKDELLGDGLWSNVYAAKVNGETEALLAVKVPTGKMAYPILANEARILSRLSSLEDSKEHVVEFFGQDAETSALVLRRANATLEACVLAEHNLEKRGGYSTGGKADPLLGASQWLRLAKSLISSLAWLQSHSVVHGDIKPTNILQVYNFHFVFSDFSSSLVISGSDENVTRATDALTRNYASPELLKGFSISHAADDTILKHQTFASDVWALACVLLFAATGHEPYAFEKIPQRVIMMAKDGMVMYGHEQSPDNKVLTRIGYSTIVRKILEPALVKLVTKRISCPDWLELVEDVAKKGGYGI